MSRPSPTVANRALDATESDMAQDSSRMDPLTQALDGVRLRCIAPNAHEMTSPWGVEFGGLPPETVRRLMRSAGLPVRPGAIPSLHGEIVAVLRGNCCFEMPLYKVKLSLAAGDVALVARKDAFVLRDDWRTPVHSIHDVGRHGNVAQRRGLRYGGGGVLTTLLTGPFYFEDSEAHPLLAALPPVIHVRGNEPNAAPWLESMLKCMNSELTALLPGFQSIVNHLAHALFVQAVRSYAASLPGESQANWFSAIFDPDLGPAIGVMHARPEEPWTVATLAEQAGTSRSAFSAQFTSRLGKPPLEYLTECRMRKAKALLRDTCLGGKSIAAKVGYSNESAFSNAFKRTIGLPPRAYRRLQATETV